MSWNVICVMICAGCCQRTEKVVYMTDYYHSPFGTGKTTTMLELILQEIKFGHKILVTAVINVAIDNILKRRE